MRKNTARHWLHAALDLLPVILIPVFMIYSHRHVLTERTEVDIQYKYQSNEVNSLNDLVEDNIYNLNYTSGDLGGDLCSFICYKLSGEINISIDDLDYANELFSIPNNYYLELYIADTYPIIYFYDLDGNSFAFNLINIEINNAIIQFVEIDEIFDTQFFATDIFSYTDYNVIESVDVQDTNSSIMNVFMDDFNYSVNKYFNMGNVFNLKDVYHWFEVNIFNNNPPVVMVSIYNIIVYEFVMDLLFLLYGLFMWFVDMLKRLIEKPINSIK